MDIGVISLIVIDPDLEPMLRTSVVPSGDQTPDQAMTHAVRSIQRYAEPNGYEVPTDDELRLRLELLEP